MTFFSLMKLRRKYRRLTRGLENKNFEAIFVDYLNRMEEGIQHISDIQEKMSGLEKKVDSCIQKVGFVRYNPFQDVGGDLSFSAAFLDHAHNGLVFTSIYSRNGCTFFSKPIQNGTSSYPLSQEENQAIQVAIQQN